jgi:TetR/AcrR family transcriptional regulator, transcriptional repressor for nem operon
VVGADAQAVRDRALATLAVMVGGITLSRALQDPALSDRMLVACRKLALEGMKQETAR